MNIIGDSTNGIFSKEIIEYVNNIKEEDLRFELKYHLRLKNNIDHDRICYKNKINTLENIILDIKETYPDIKIPTMKETAEKHGELPSYISYKKKLNKLK